MELLVVLNVPLDMIILTKDHKELVIKSMLISPFNHFSAGLFGIFKPLIGVNCVISFAMKATFDVT